MMMDQMLLRSSTSTCSVTLEVQETAVALDQAMQVMRERKGMTIDCWINFIHIVA
jgi:hypothetical protein